jgi:hypothetical protein
MNTPEETEFKLPVNVAITSMPRQNTMVFIGGVIAYGVLTMALLATLAVMLGSPLALLGLAAASATAYANFTFAHAVNAGHFAAIGYHNLVRLTNFTAMLCCIIVLFVAVHLAALAS